MAYQQVKLYDYIEPILTLPAGRLTKDNLLVPRFRLYGQDAMEIYYAPFESVNTDARVVIVGITPGFTQMEISYRVVRAALLEKQQPEKALQLVKQQASFAGTMRQNLIAMLDGIGLAEALGIETTDTLFGVDRQYLHSTSVLRYPVFIQGENYTGHKPALLKADVFRAYIHEYFEPEILQLQQALFVPLGKAVAEVLQLSVSAGVLQNEQVLMHFPHPSGANGHRKRQYEDNKTSFTKTVTNWFRQPQ